MINLLAHPIRTAHTWIGKVWRQLQQGLERWLSVPVPQRTPALVPIPIRTDQHRARRTIKLRHLR